MKKRIAVLALGLALVPRAGTAQEIRRLPLDDTSTLGLRIEADPKVKVEGRASLKITTLSTTSVCLGEVTGFGVEGARLVYKARVKTELTGAAYLEMWVQVGNGSFFSRGLDQQVKGKSDWKVVQTPFLLQKGQKAEKATLNLVIEGRGAVWVDDVVLSKEPLGN